MNALREFFEAVGLASRANAVTAQKSKHPPLRTQLYIHGQSLVQVKDADTGRVLGCRRSVNDARTLAAQLERGELTA